MSVAEEYGFDFSQETCENAYIDGYPCRKCLPCLIRRQKAWVSRLVEELRCHDQNYFVTLTYDDAHLPFDSKGQMCFSRQHLIKLNRDIRKRYQEGRFRNEYEHVIYGSPEFLELPLDVKYKYYITSEYGPSESGTHRPHYHAVFYGMQVPLYTFELLLRSLWSYGFVSVFPAEDGAAGYISKYLVTDGVGKKSYQDDDQMSPFALMSKGLGLSYVDRMGDWHRAAPRKRLFTQYHGQRGSMDRYLKHKIFDDAFFESYGPEMLQKAAALRGKYQQFKQDHPLLYCRLLEERRKYFEDMAKSIEWNTLKKHKL